MPLKSLKLGLQKLLQLQTNKHSRKAVPGPRQEGCFRD